MREKQRKIRGNCGITLIALVVTIVVLLILAGVSISMLSGDNGIINKAINAAKETNKAAQIEEIQLEIFNKTLVNDGEITEDELKTILLSYGTLSTEENLLDKTLTISKDGTQIKVTEIYNDLFWEEDVEKSISLNSSQVSIAVGEEETLTATLTGLTGDITWSIEDESIAKISNSNVITADIQGISKGNTIVTAKCGNYKATCEIIVDESLAVTVTQTKRNMTSAELTVTVSNRDLDAVDVTYVCYVKVKNSADSTYVEKYNGIDNGESTVITINELQDLNSYDVKIEATDSNGITGIGTCSIGQYCFVEGTKVLTETGLKNIEDINVGDKVYTLNLNNNQRELKEVTYTFEGTTLETYEFTINNEKIKTTPMHKFYIQDKGWIRAYEVEIGDKLIAKDNNMEITDIEYIYHKEPVKIYNMTVEDNHNYLITEYELLVHNAGSK